MADALHSGVYWAMKGSWLIGQHKKHSKMYSLVICLCTPELVFIYRAGIGCGL